MDLKFPHHENEIAQCEIVNQTHLANFWVHNGMINIDHIKMSKSLGNIQWAKDLIEKFSGNMVRWILISTHYRAPLELTKETFVQAEKELNRVQTAFNSANVKLQIANIEETKELDQGLWQQFIDYLNDDLNTPNAISTVFDLTKQLNQVLRKRDVDFELVNRLKNTLDQMLYVLGIQFELITVSEADKELYHQWKNAVSEKNYDVADQYRKTLQEKGII